MPQHRLFVGNIPAGTTEQELQQEFSSYGPVAAIDLKSKPNPLNDSVDTFAFINIDLDDRTLRQCITEFRQEQYKGAYLNVSKAKESFLDRLKREREESELAKQNSGALNPYKKAAPEKQAVVGKSEPLPELPTIRKDVSSSSSESESSDESEDEVPATTVPVKRDRSKPATQDDQLVRKWNQETYIEHGKLKIVPITGQVKEVIEMSGNRKQQQQQQERDLNEKARLADEKRKQGLTKLKSAYEQQKLAIQASLAGGDGTGKKKIVFDDEDDDDAGGRGRLALFDDEEEDGFKGNFTVRKQLGENTEEGQRLFEMQTQFHGDTRFKLDERFLGDDTPSQRKKMRGMKADSELNSAKVPQNQERKKQLEILSKVTGRDIVDRSQHKKDESALRKMQRFDPASHQAADDQSEKVGNKKLTEEELLELKKADRPEQDFQVSEEKFYKVSGNLNQVIGSSTGGFSLLSMFGSADNDDKMEEEEPEHHSGDNEKPIFSEARFKYESSASEDEDDAEGDGPSDENKESVPEVAQDEEPKAKKRRGGYLSRQGFLKETFFFMPDDVRLDEGRAFFTQFASHAAVARADESKDIRKIFKKRRMRETKNVNQRRAKRGLKMFKSKRK